MKLLLDEHISPVVAQQLRSHDLEAAALQEWQGGAFLEASDTDLLLAAAQAGWTLVTYDLRTIPPLLKIWGETGINHGGVVFIDHRTVTPNDYGPLCQAILQLVPSLGNASWMNRVVFLSRSR